ncbi:MAG: amino acid ABC transporter permease [Candidatus Hadarchaeum sp.]|uniref:amino acid ABC transporter permease n=1 Tax=Candidatus Hadarchaeum sp. TaxID=2883567 RepID=UPI00317D5087
MLLEWFPLFLNGLVVTLQVFALACLFAICVGISVAAALTLPNTIIHLGLRGYISIFRNSPLLVQLFFLFYGLPFLGIRIPPFWCGVIGITLNEGAFIAEIVRGCIQNLNREQWTAGFSLGLTYGQVLRLIILPQAIRDAIPAVAGQTSIIVKDTSLLSLIMVYELTRVSNLVYNRTFNTVSFFTAAALYLILFTVLSLFARTLEQKYHVKR